MAITAAVCNSFKDEMAEGVHTSAHTYKLALFTSAATLNKSTTSYTGLSDEVSNAGTNYTTGGETLAGFSSALDGDTAVRTFNTPITWANASFTARGALLYNDSLAGKNAVQVFDFGSDKTATADTFTVNLPAATAIAGLLRIT